MQTENEARFLAVDVDKTIAILREHGAALHRPRALMRRVVLKNDDITARGGWLRLRDEGDQVTLTYKQTTSDTPAIDTTLEAEITVSGFEETLRLLVAMGFRTVRFQENFREEWRLDQARFDFDTWPGLDTFLEIEGPDQATVYHAATLLDLSMADATFGSVDEVYRAVLGRDILAEDRLVFDDTIRFTWHESPAPEAMPVTQVYVWALDPDDGRVLIQDRGADHPDRYMLPGGRPEPADGGDPLATAYREAMEESQVHIDTGRAIFLGHQVVTGDPARPEPYAQLRYAAPITAYEPIGPDPDTDDGRINRRLMTSLTQAPELLGWGAHATAQAQAALRAGAEMGIPSDTPHPDGYRDAGDA